MSDPGDAMEPSVPDGSVSNDALALPSGSQRGLVVPDQQQLELLLGDTTGVDKLGGLNNLAALYLEAAKRVDLAREELVRLAVYRIKVERKFGAELAQCVALQGDRSRSQSGTWLPGGLPKGLSKQDAGRLRELAAIPEESFQCYLESQRQKQNLPTSNGLRVFAKPSRLSKEKGKSKGRRGKASVAAQTQGIIAACGAAIRLLGDIDVLVGDAEVQCQTRVRANTVRKGQLSGRVLIVDCPDPGAWIPKLAQLRLSSEIEQVVVVLAVESGDDWFRDLANSDWHCCFFHGPSGLMAIYHGPRAEAFFAAFEGLGVVMDTHPK